MVRVVAIAPAVDTLTNAASVVVRIPNASLVLRPGTGAVATVDAGIRRALIVPDSAPRYLACGTPCPAIDVPRQVFRRVTDRSSGLNMHGTVSALPSISRNAFSVLLTLGIQSWVRSSRSEHPRGEASAPAGQFVADPVLELVDDEVDQLVPFSWSQRVGHRL